MTDKPELDDAPDVLEQGEGMGDLDVITANDERDSLRHDVALMRTLGVSQWKGIVLGPVPSTHLHVPQSTQPSLTPEEQEQIDRDARRRGVSAAFGGPVKPLGRRS